MSDVWKGTAYPWDNTLRGTIDPKEDKYVLPSSVVNIVMTRLRERVMLPEFGSDVAGALFEPNTSITVDNVETSVRDAIARWDDRIDVVSVSVEHTENTMRCQILFRNEKDPLSFDPQVASFEIGQNGELL